MAGMLRIAGYTVIHSPSIGVKYRPKKVKRSLRERLFSFPWHPFKKYRTESERYLDEAMYFAPGLGAGVVYMNSAFLPKLMKMLEEARTEMGLEEIIEHF